MCDHDDCVVLELRTYELLHLGVRLGVNAACSTWSTQINHYQFMSWETCLLVGSSSINSFPGFSIALTRQNNCLCPCENVSVSTIMSRISDTSAEVRPVLCNNTSHRPTLRSAEAIVSSEDAPSGSRLLLTDPANRKGSWVRDTSRSRTTGPGTVAKSTPSSMIRPDTMSMSPRIASAFELFPLLVVLQSDPWSSSTKSEKRNIPACPANYANLLASLNRERDIFKGRGHMLTITA